MPAKEEIFNNIPPELQERPQWVLWRQEAPNGRSKPTKVPYSPLSGKKASTVSPETWGAFKQTVKAFSDDFAGIGFVFSATDPFLGIDLDNAIDDEDKIKSWAKDIIDRLDSYTELSPSGKGIHIIVVAQKTGERCRTRYHDGEAEMYSEGRYFTFTGNSLDTPPKGVEDRQAELDKLYKDVFRSNDQPELTPAVETTSLSRKNEYLTDEQIVEKASKAKNGDKFRRLWVGDHSGYRSQSEADQSLCNILAFWVGNDPERIDRLFSRSGLYRAEKWGKRKDYRERTTQKAIKASSVTSSMPQEAEPEENVTNESNPEEARSALFPNVMSGLAGDIAKLYSAHLESPPHFFYMTTLTCLGSVLSGHVTLDSALRPQPRMYVILLGESADDRKSTAINVVVDFFQSANVGLAISNGVGSAEGLQGALEREGNLLLVQDELKQLVSKCGIQGSTLLPILSTLFESNKVENETKDKRICVENGHLSILAASTLDTYERAWDSAFTDIGLTNRLFLVPGRGERKYALPQSIPQGGKQELQIRLGGIVRGVRDNPLLHVTHGALARFDDWYMSLPRSVHTKRLDTYGHRLMILLAVNDGKSEVDEETAEKVIELLRWQFEVRCIYDPIDADGKVAKMEEKIRRQLQAKGPLKERELRQCTSADRDGLWAFRMALQNCRAANDIAQDPKTKIWRRL